MPNSALFAVSPVSEAFISFSSSANGLSEDTARKRIETYGPNTLETGEEESLFSKFIDQFKNPLILMLLGSAAISILMKQIDDAVSITLAILIVVSGIFLMD
jgi:Ca2+-transporting ATPase